MDIGQVLLKLADTLRSVSKLAAWEVSWIGHCLVLATIIIRGLNTMVSNSESKRDVFEKNFDLKF